MSRILVATWAPGGNLPPLLASASVLARRGHDVHVLASEATLPAAEAAGFETLVYETAPNPETRVPFEEQAGAMMATAAGSWLARDVRAALGRSRPDVVVADCMLPAALAAGEAAGTPTVSLVHFLYGLARSQMMQRGGSWTTDLETLNATRAELELATFDSGLAAWEAPDLVLVTAPRWLDVEIEYRAHVVHAGPLDVRMAREPGMQRERRVLLSFSTTAMHGQLDAVRRACDAIGASDVQATLTLGPAIERDALDLPRNVEVAAFVDHDELLPSCAAVLGHGGLGTTLRALAHGVPLVLLPLGRDQHFNAGRVAQLGAGISLKPETPAVGIRAALNRVLTEPGFGAAASAAGARIAAEEPDRRAAAAVEGLAEE
jgi:MGT family glycosyltransferase